MVCPYYVERSEGCVSDYFPACNLRLEHLKLEIGAQLTDDLKFHAVINRETYRKHA